MYFGRKKRKINAKFTTMETEIWSTGKEEAEAVVEVDREEVSVGKVGIERMIHVGDAVIPDIGREAALPVKKVSQHDAAHNDCRERKAECDRDGKALEKDLDPEDCLKIVTEQRQNDTDEEEMCEDLLDLEDILLSNGPVKPEVTLMVQDQLVVFLCDTGACRTVRRLCPVQG